MYISPEPLGVGRKIVQLPDGRNVHFRFAGDGPPVLLLHQSPTSSAELASVIEKFAANGFTAIAPDTPGFGLSDSLPPGPPNLGRLADSLKAFVDVIGIEKCGVYGFHTGAMIAAEFSRRHPDLCSVAVLNGFVVMDPEPVADILKHYFDNPALGWDGAHMAWMWARIYDQGIFFPWYAKKRETLFAGYVAPPAATHRRLLDYLRTDLNDTTAYQSAFLYDSRQHAKELTAPTYMLNYRADAIASHTASLEDVSAAVTREMLDTPDDVYARTITLFGRYLEGAACINVADCPTGGPQARFIKTDIGNIHVRIAGEGPAVLLLHDAGQSLEALAPLATELAGRHRVISIDLPGHGETGQLHHANDYAPRVLAESVAAVMRSLNVLTFAIVGVGAGGVVAAELAGAEPAFDISRLCTVDPWLFDPDERAARAEKLAPAFKPTKAGTHMLEAWYQARDREFFNPWYDGGPQTIIRRSEPYDIEWVQARALDLLKAGDATRPFTQAALGVDYAAMLAELKTALTFVCFDGDEATQRETQIRACAPSATILRTSPAPGAVAQKVCEAF